MTVSVVGQMLHGDDDDGATLRRLASAVLRPVQLILCRTADDIGCSRLSSRQYNAFHIEGVLNFVLLTK